MSEASFCFYKNILVETKEKLFPLLLSKFLRILLLLEIFIFIPLALWYYLSLVIKKCQQFFFFLPFSFGWKFWDLINSFKLIKSGCVTVQRSFTIINKPFAHAGGVLFKNIEGLYTPSDLVSKILARCLFLQGFLAQVFHYLLDFSKKLRKLGE